MIKYLEKEEDFDNLTKSGKYLIDFYADWCGPCKMFGKVLENVDFIDVLKINVDTFPNLATRYGIMSIPTILFIKDGVEKHKEIGFKNLEEIKEIVKNL